MNELKRHRQSVLEEREALNSKLDKLEEFIKSNDFDWLDEDEKSRLCQQSIAMARYSDILTQRIKAFD